MVEDVPGSPQGGPSRKVLFLTSAQAELLAGNAGSMELLLSALEIPMEGPGSPKVTLKLGPAKGFSDHLNAKENKTEGERKGLDRIKPPFLSDEEERLAEQRLDIFLADVLLPLAARTHAIVFVNAFPSSCLLTKAFLRMVALHRGKWGGALPFWIIAMTSSMQNLYRNPDAHSEWRFVRQHCRAWGYRDAAILEAMRRKLGSPKQDGTYPNTPVFNHDFHPEPSVLILSDNIDSNETTPKFGTDRCFDALQTQLVSFLSAKLPHVAIQTGTPYKKVRSTRNVDGFGKEFAGSIETCASGAPVVYLDLRRREPVCGDHAERVQQAMKKVGGPL